MPAVLQIGSKAGAGSVAASSTFFFPIGITNASLNATENTMQRTIRSAGTFTHLSIVVSANDRGASAFTLRINGVDGTVTCPITASVPGTYEDLTHSDAVVAGNLVGIKLVTGAGGTTFVYRVMTVLFTATSGHAVSLWTGINGNGLTTASTTVFVPVGGQITEVATEANVQLKVQAAGTWRNLAAFVRTDSRSTNSTVKSRINGADGAQLVTCTFGVPGWYEDLTHSDTLAVNDLIDVAVTLGTGAGTFRLWSAQSDFDTTEVAHTVAASGSGVITIAASASIYMAAAGFGTSTDATEANEQCEANSTFRASRLECYVQTNSVTSGSTLQLRKNGANATNVLAITASVAGWYADLTHTDTFTPNDLLSLLLTAGAGGTTMTVGVYAMIWTYPHAYSDALTLGACTVAGVSAGVPVTRRIVGTPGSTSIAGVSAAVPITRRLAASTGATTVAGVSAALPIARRIAASAGALTVAGVSAGLSIIRRLLALAGNLVIAGLDALFPVTLGSGSEDAALDGDVSLAPYLSGAAATGPALIGPVLITAALDGYSYGSAALTGSITTQPS